MRTTIEIRDDQRAKLLALAAERGEKGFSILVQEALDQYFSTAAEQEEKVEAAIHALGALDDEAAAELRESVRAIRGRWR